MSKLRLTAQDNSDLEIMASAVQDAILRVGEIYFDKQARSLTFRLSRFRNEDEKNARVLCGLRFDSVMDIQTRGIDRTDPEALMVLLEIFFKPEDEPAGAVHAVFAGGGELRARVECLDAILVDTENNRATDKRPLHPE